MKATDLRAFSEEELNIKLKELKTELFNLRLQAVTGQLDNHRKIRIVKKDIARVQTVQVQRSLADVKEGIA